MNDDTAYPQSPGSTIMSILQGAADGDPQARRTQIERFVKQYGHPLKAHLVFRRGVSSQQADDWLQDFLAEKLLVADPTRCLVWRYLEKRRAHPEIRFRAYLLMALNNYVIDRRRAAKHDERPMEHGEIESDGDAPDHFDRDWANNLLHQTLEAVRAECLEYGQEDIWRAFEMRVVAPARDGTEPPSYEDMVRELGFATPKQASNRLQTAIRKFNRLVRELVARYLPADANDDVEAAIREEIRDLRRILANPGALRLPDARPADESLSLLGPSFFSIDSRADSLWTPADLAGMWRHTLSLPLAQVLIECNRETVEQCLEVARGGGHAIETLDDLWRHESPPLELLRAIKDDAKFVVKRDAEPPSRSRIGDSPPPHSALPSMIGVVMYLGAIAIALLRLETRITRDADTVFERRLNSVLKCAWIDAHTRSLFQQWRDRIGA